LFFLAGFLAGDVILWVSVRRWLSRLQAGLRLVLSVFFWLPSAVIISLVGLGIFLPFIVWPVAVRTYLLSFLLIFISLKAFPLVFLLISWLLDLIIRLFTKSTGKVPGRVRRAGWWAGGLFALLLLSGMVFWIYDFKVRTIVCESPGIPSSFNSFRIVQISDVHLGNWTCRSRLEEAVRMINNLRPDIIVFTGDMFTFSTYEGRDFREILGKLHAGYGIFTIMGNHDYGDYVRWKDMRLKELNFRDLKEFYSGLGWELLLNRSKAIRKGNDSIYLIGLENWGAARRFQKYGNLDKALDGINRSSYCILLSHDPSFWDSISSRTHPEIELTLSGHTHGGQFGIETRFFRWSILSASNHLWSGLYTRKKGQFTSSLYVNRGLGTIGFAGRIGIRPEITLILLHHKN
jgi:uncharacterized protein